MKWCGLLVSLTFVLLACEDPKPPLSGRLRGPSTAAVFKGCPQDKPGCTDNKHPLLLIANALSDDVRIFDADEDTRSFFEADNPLFPFVIPVGSFPRAIAVEPNGEYAFVVNQLSDDVSVIDLNRLVEIDTNDDAEVGSAPSLQCDQYPNSDRCLAGVTRLQLPENAQAEDIALPTAWGQEAPLPIFVSLPGTGQVKRFNIQLPDQTNPGNPTSVSDELIDVGGIPSGLAIDRMGTTLFIANEESHEISAYDIAQGTLTTIDVGGPSRKVYVTPKRYVEEGEEVEDEPVVYVLRSDQSRIALVDAVNLVRMNAGLLEDKPTAHNPLEVVAQGEFRDIILPGLPQSLVFVTGRPIKVAYRDFSRVYYTANYNHPDGKKELDEEGQEIEVEKPGEIVRLFAYVSNLDGSLYFIDAENHRGIDDQGHTGATVNANGYSKEEGALVLNDLFDPEADPDNCVDVPNQCKYPMIAGFKNGAETGVEIVDGVTTSETFSVAWEGVLPNTLSGTGSFEFNDESGLKLLESRPDGLKSADLREGDILELRTSFVCPPSEGSAVPRYYLIGTPEFTQDQAGNWSAEIPLVSTENGQSVLNLKACWGETVSYRMRAKQAWVVVGTSSGQLDRIEASTMRNVGDEITEPTYANDLFALTMLYPAVDESGDPYQPGVSASDKFKRDSVWYFTTTSGHYPARFSPSLSIASAGELVVVDYEFGKNDTEEQLDEDPETQEVRPKDDRVFVLYETSDAFMEISTKNFNNRLWQ